VIANQARYGDDFEALASPVCGSGVNASYPERLMYSILIDNDEPLNADQLAQHTWETMLLSGRRMVKDAKPMQANAENLAALRAIAEVTLEHQLPLWKTLGIL
jgi:hypothetical protein